MPELPEVEIARRNLERWWVGKEVKRIDLPDPRVVHGGSLEQLMGKSVLAARRRGKHLLVDLEQSVSVLLHFRMTGKIVRWSQERAQKEKARCVFHVGDESFAFVDSRCLGHLEVLSREDLDAHKSLATMGPEPWPEVLSPRILRENLGRTRRAIKIAIMDQQIMAGVGNIVASESLWLARINPTRKASSLTEDELGRLTESIRDVCNRTLELEDGDEVYYLNDPKAQAHEEVFRVYQQSTCQRCGGDILRLTQGGRATYCCPVCQGVS